MKRLFSFLFFALALTASAVDRSTITGPIGDLSGSFAGRIEFWPLSTGYFLGNVPIVGTFRSVAITNGSFYTTLAAGRYLIKFPPTTNYFFGYVPIGTNTYTLSQIVTNVFVVVDLNALHGATNQTPLLQDVNAATYAITNLSRLALGGNSINSWDDVTNYFTQTGTGGGGSSTDPRFTSSPGTITPASNNFAVVNTLTASSVSAANLSGSGASITGLNANNIAAGTVPEANSAHTLTNVTIWGGVYRGLASWLTNSFGVSAFPTNAGTPGQIIALTPDMTNTYFIDPTGAGDMLKANNLSDLQSTATGRTNIGANDAGNLTAGTIGLARLPNSVVTNNYSILLQLKNLLRSTAGATFSSVTRSNSSAPTGYRNTTDRPTADSRWVFSFQSDDTLSTSDLWEVNLTNGNFSLLSGGQYNGNGGGLTNIPITGITQPGVIVTNGESQAITFSNAVTVVGTFTATTLNLATNNSTNLFLVGLSNDYARLTSSGQLTSTRNGNGWTNIPLISTLSIPIGAWSSNNVTATDMTPASAVTLTNTGDSFIFADSVSNTIMTRLTMPSDWDGGTVKFSLWVFAAGTNNSTATKSVWSVEGSASTNTTSPTWGTAITVTNTISTNAFQATEAITRAITIGDSPVARGTTLWRIKRLGAATGDTETNTLHLADTALHINRNSITNFPTETP